MQAWFAFGLPKANAFKLFDFTPKRKEEAVHFGNKVPKRQVRGVPRLPRQFASF
ncbi:MAG: hypothetical protein JST93_02960 [Acidobacteria bacterium]|nr:hypothetical protein [Acidobacteriota bacterium]